MTQTKRYIIGKSDRADFPFFCLKHVRVKVDTGAYTSSIHCESIVEEDDMLKVVFLSNNYSSYTGEVVTFNEYEIKKVRSSSGKSQFRYKVNGNILLFGTIFKTDFTLTNRAKMKYPVLLGRKLLNKNFLVNTALKNLSEENNIEKL